MPLPDSDLAAREELEDAVVLGLLHAQAAIRHRDPPRAGSTVRKDLEFLGKCSPEYLSAFEIRFRNTRSS